MRDQALSLGLLALLFLTLTWSIQTAAWTDGLGVLVWIALLAICIGFLLGLSRWPAFLAHCYSLVLGFLALLLIFAAQTPANLSWAERSMNVIVRVQHWVNILIAKQANYDNLVFVIQLAFYLWLFAYLSAWGLFRRRSAGWAVIPCGIGLLFNLYYAPPELSLYFLQYLLLALALVMRLHFQGRRLAWAAANVGYTIEVGFDFFRDGLLIAGVALLLAWSLPAVPNLSRLTRIGDRFESSWRGVQDEWNRMFGSLRSYYQREGDLFNRTMLLGGPVNLTDTPILDIEASQGRYWRAMAYDLYNGRGWATTYEEIGLLGKGTTALADPPYLLRQPLRQAVRVLLPSTRTIVAAAQLTDIDVATQAHLISLPFEDIEPETKNRRPPADIAAAEARVRLRAGDIYQVVSSISVADEESLRQAGTEYDAWITGRYFQLPMDLPQRVTQLARRITGSRNLTNPYDRAVAIERYLRQYRYNDKVEAPPEGVDAVDYFLFDSRQGYCDYYASAMVILARAAGIPARLARGYAQGEKYPDTDVFRVREKNGHAWPELYFPGYGWVEFEPTASQALIERPKPRAVPTPAGENGADPFQLPEREDLPPPFQSDAASQTQQQGWLMRFVETSGRPVGMGLLIFVALVVVARTVWRILEPRGLPVGALHAVRHVAGVLGHRARERRQHPGHGLGGAGGEREHRGHGDDGGDQGACQAQVECLDEGITEEAEYRDHEGRDARRAQRVVGSDERVDDHRAHEHDDEHRHRAEPEDPEHHPGQHEAEDRAADAAGHAHGGTREIGTQHPGQGHGDPVVVRKAHGDGQARAHQLGSGQPDGVAQHEVVESCRAHQPRQRLLGSVEGQRNRPHAARVHSVPQRGQCLAKPEAHLLHRHPHAIVGDGGARLGGGVHARRTVGEPTAPPSHLHGMADRDGELRCAAQELIEENLFIGGYPCRRAQEHHAADAQVAAGVQEVLVLSLHVGAAVHRLHARPGGVQLDHRVRLVGHERRPRQGIAHRAVGDADVRPHATGAPEGLRKHADHQLDGASHEHEQAVAHRHARGQRRSRVDDEDDQAEQADQPRPGPGLGGVAAGEGHDSRDDESQPPLVRCQHAERAGHRDADGREGHSLCARCRRAALVAGPGEQRADARRNGGLRVPERDQHRHQGGDHHRSAPGDDPAN